MCSLITLQQLMPFTGEYWLGLRTIHQFTTSATSLWVHIETFGDRQPLTVDAYYDAFTVDNASAKYRLHVSGFTGNCGDSLTYHNGRMFTTKDRDNGPAGYNCAVRFKGAFWHNACHNANPTGTYYNGTYTNYGSGLSWHSCFDHTYSPKVYILKFKRNV